MAFRGLSTDTITFLKQLEKNNSKAFFDANKGRFESAWVEPAQALVVEVGERVQKFAPTIHFEPRIGGSLMRPNRDIRFSKDKSPYKTHLDLWFWDGEEKGWERPGFFFRLTKSQLLCGAGTHGLTKDGLAKFRAAVDDGTRGPALTKLVVALRKRGVEIGQEAYKKVPRGFSPEHPRAELLRFGALHAAVTTPIPEELTSPKLVSVVVERFKTVSPVRQWLADALDA